MSRREPKTERAIDMLQMAIEYGEACSVCGRRGPSRRGRLRASGCTSEAVS